MAEQGSSFQKILIAFIFISLFAVFFVTWAVGLGEEYGDDYGQNPEYVTSMLGVDDLTDQLLETQEQAEGWRESFESQNVFSIIGGIVVTGIFDLATFMTKSIMAPFRLFGNVLTGVLGLPALFVNIITAILVIAIIFGIWRLIKIGY